MTAQVDSKADSDCLARRLRIVDIRSLNARDLEPLLLEQTADWELQLDWDFLKTADLVRRLANARRLVGAALLDRGAVAGYAYVGQEGHKGVIADVYVRPNWRSGNAEVVLLRVMLDALIGASGVRRIESQLMMVEAASAKELERQRIVRLFERLLMKLDPDVSLPPGRTSTIQRFHIGAWCDRHYDSAAEVLSLAHVGHIDSEIDDRYRTLAGARHFLSDIVRSAGRFAFHQPASYVAFDMTTGFLAGMSFSSFVADDAAYISELCVAPHARREGLGYELLRRSVATLRSAGAKRIGLTVTAANEDAVRLYSRCGFGEARRFYAYVWEGP